MITLKWALTNDCNLRCRTCYNADFYSREEFPFERVKSIIEEVKSLNVDRIDLLGGEPMKYSRFDDFCKLALHNGIALTMSTNATLFDQAKIQMYKDAFSQITISLDGFTEEDNDEIRGKGVFIKVQQALNMLADAEVPVNLNCTLSKKGMSNLHLVKNILESYKNIQSVSIAVPLLTGRAKTDANTSLWITMKEYLERVDVFCQNYRDLIVKRSIAFSAPPLVLWYFDQKYQINQYIPLHDYCMGGSMVYYIDATGIILPCNLPYGRYGLNMIQQQEKTSLRNNIVDRPLTEVLSEPIYNQFFSHVRSFNEQSKTDTRQCMDCPFFKYKFCAPQCPFMDEPRETIEMCKVLLMQEEAQDIFQSAEKFLKELTVSEN